MSEDNGTITSDMLAQYTIGSCLPKYAGHVEICLGLTIPVLKLPTTEQRVEMERLLGWKWTEYEQ